MTTDPDAPETPTLGQARTQLRRYGLESEIDPQAVLVAVRLLATGARLGQATETHFARFGLSTGRYRLLADLEDADGEKSPSQLASSLGVTRATVTGLIDGLEQQGLVCRRASAEDGRAVVVVLTARGAQLLRDMAAEHFGRLQSMVGGLTRTERTVFLDLLERIGHGMGALTAD
ncbi:MarR family transcriptional regulator [Nocardia sp. NPDC046473]|uniref:MarR family winged helix-turn-helix transcriptional regulator n=1 Tax=Nocardia sp. NPDC046473 TaxID=3155733 RepID=UPI0033D4C632